MTTRPLHQPEPNVVLAAIYRVDDFDSWAATFDELEVWLARAGVLRLILYRAVDDPHEVMVILDVSSRSEAEALVSNREELAAYFDRAGIAIYPSVFMGEEVKRWAGVAHRPDFPGTPPSRSKVPGPEEG